MGFSSSLVDDKNSRSNPKKKSPLVITPPAIGILSVIGMLRYLALDEFVHHAVQEVPNGAVMAVDHSELR